MNFALELPNACMTRLEQSLESDSMSERALLWIGAGAVSRGGVGGVLALGSTGNELGDLGVFADWVETEEVRW